MAELVLRKIGVSKRMISKTILVFIFGFLCAEIYSILVWMLHG